jgi:DNA-binding response OmpR family regulator
MGPKRVLVIEDDAGIREGILAALAAGGYATEQAGDGDAGLELAVTYDCDLILLDLVLPGPDGLEILREVRETRPALPVIILTARGEEADRVAGLRGGADDYVVKPFSVAELLARVEAVLRRSVDRPASVESVPLPDGVVDLARREVLRDDGERVELSEREAELLAFLAGHRGRAVSREEILLRVWRIDPTNLDTRTVDMTVARLREKLRDDPADAQVLRTVRGKGYMLT